MWDHEARYPDVTPEYCQSACGDKVCADCPRPKLLTENLAPLTGYLAVSTQWCHGPSGHRTGLRYGDCLPVLERHASRLAAESALEVSVDELFDDVQVIERAFIEAAGELAAAARAERGES